MKALLDPIIDFGVKTGAEAYADSLPPFLKDAIHQHDVLVGMNSKMVLAAMGAPQSKVRELVPGSTEQHYEEWIYGQAPQTVRFVRFERDRVTQLRIAALGKPIAIHDRNEMRGYLDGENPDTAREIALGDSNPPEKMGPRPSPPTILKPGEVAPGSEQRVRLPVSLPDTPPDKTTLRRRLQTRRPSRGIRRWPHLARPMQMLGRLPLRRRISLLRMRPRSCQAHRLIDPTPPLPVLKMVWREFSAAHAMGLCGQVRNPAEYNRQPYVTWHVLASAMTEVRSARTR